MMIVALLCLLSLASALPSGRDSTIGTLTIQEVQKRDTGTRISGVFESNAGDGIEFHVSETSVALTTLGEKSILVNVQQFPLTIQSYGDEGKATYFQIMDEAFVTSNKEVYRIPASDTIDATAGKYMLTHSELLASIQGELMDNPQSVIQESVQRLVQHPATPLLEPAARALAEKLGVSGREEPAVAPFFVTAMRMTELYEESRRSSAGSVFTRSMDSRLFAVAQGQYPYCNLKSCPPCEEDNCFGMCGRICSCWGFVCGDCCYHHGCLIHDICCREEGYFSMTCLFPMRFSCDSYSC